MAPVVSMVRALTTGTWRWRRVASPCQRWTCFLSADRVEYRARAAHTTERERARTVAAFYNQPAIEAAAQKKTVRLTPSAILYHGRTDDEATTLVVSGDNSSIHLYSGQNIVQREFLT